MENIILIAQQLSKEGKVPNTALIKARLLKKVPLPMIIQGLKMWKENPQKEIPIATMQAPPLDNENAHFERRVDAKIEQALAPLITEIVSLQRQLNQLQKQLAKEE
ncbi:hypothetical protein [Psychromonas antarctica]|jgi:hypothetical protein|uniref:hypothetical protein n=1 Tax=Psychromonas antarctica TaxID=67573 RepID=UPI001EE936B9|nr:hypothetical protein [Psychromonas antarctica]MCG6201275.1 hypothetical protein [Psychromonas antarctica]